MDFVIFFTTKNFFYLEAKEVTCSIFLDYDIDFCGLKFIRLIGTLSSK